MIILNLSSVISEALCKCVRCKMNWQIIWLSVVVIWWKPDSFRLSSRTESGDIFRIFRFCQYLNRLCPDVNFHFFAIQNHRVSQNSFLSLIRSEGFCMIFFHSANKEWFTFNYGTNLSFQFLCRFRLDLVWNSLLWLLTCVE